MSAIKLGKIIGVNLQKARKARRYTQEEVAKKVDLTANYYATLERGEATASIETYYAIFVVLGVRASDVFPDKV
ncbi:MAG TPA: helix-turn-helix transcriptional regulator [Candidatus Saccharimonadales bacterium]|nr:helix-turn-helix transcriptional regulator [Candidatus Saccharimonadales bacterium]